jgi:8-oxo-dGTP pyrophosphatase MutT (NUDIX family)
VPPSHISCPRAAWRYVREVEIGERRIESAVLVPVFRDAESELRLVLVVRGSRGLHGGQLGLPGGQTEPHDSSPLATALRETEEEIGLAQEEVAVLAALPPVDTRTTGFRVHPFVARISPPAQWQLAPGEISAVLTPLVSVLADPSAREERRLSFPARPEDRLVESVPIEGGHILWGLTLRLLDPVFPRLLAGEWAI